METTLKEKQLKVLNDTINAFNSTNRCTNEKGDCQYYMEGKQGCAVGRLIEDKELCKQLDLGINCGISSHEVFKQLPIELKDLTQDFLYKLQDLHDNFHYWNEKGLTQSGLIKVQGIKIEFGL